MCDHNPYPQEAEDIRNLIQQAFTVYYNTIADLSGQYIPVNGEFIKEFLEIAKMELQPLLDECGPFTKANKFIRNDDIKTMEKAVQNYYGEIQDFKEH